jgi:hypothetical protein
MENCNREHEATVKGSLPQLLEGNSHCVQRIWGCGEVAVWLQLRKPGPVENVSCHSAVPTLQNPVQVHKKYLQKLVYFGPRLKKVHFQVLDSHHL